MKSDEPSSPNGNISPINGSISNLADDSKASSSKTARKGEPLFERLPNFSRVTPAQLAHIIFPADGRYQPVRAVTTKTPPGTKNNSKAAAVPPAGSKSATAALGLASEKYAGGGGILILVDEYPDEEAEFVEFEAPAAAGAPTEAVPNGSIPNGHATTGATAAGPASGPHIALDEDAPEADPPESFEVRCSLYLVHLGSIAD